MNDVATFRVASAVVGDGFIRCRPRSPGMVSKMNAYFRFFGASLLLLLVGCTHVAEIRTHHGPGTDLLEAEKINDFNPSSQCTYPDSTDPSRANSIEDYTVGGVESFWTGFVEFDDEGWLYKSQTSQASQLKVFQDRLNEDLHNPVFDNTDFLVVAFVHGWHHNANDLDCNVLEFRAMLKAANARYADIYKHGGFAHPRRVIGLYVGWRGESLNVTGLRYTTVFDRRNAAERVAKGDVRELFAVLRKVQFAQAPKRADRMRTIVVGHSYGGLIAYHGLSPAILNELTLTKPEILDGKCSASAEIQKDKLVMKQSPVDPSGPAVVYPVFPDMLTLINPAFEGTRFEALHELMRPVDGCPYVEQRPKVVVVTADNDSATGSTFTVERKVVTLLEAYPAEDVSGRASNERDSNLHAIGFVDRYRTHRLCLRAPAVGQDPVAVASLTPPRTPEWPMTNRFAPVWVVRAPPEIVDGHNGFLYAKPDPAKTKQEPYLLDWLITLHAGNVGDNSPAMTGEHQCDVPSNP
jgi:hypothetical protein